MTATTALDLDLDMLAADIAELLGRYEYPVDASASDIRPALPAFIDQVIANARASTAAARKASDDAASWTAGQDADVDDAPTPQTGRMASVRRFYGVPAYRGREVKFRGIAHTIISSTGSHLWLRCARTGARIGPCHPTWEMDYCDARDYGAETNARIAAFNERINRAS